MTAQSIIAEVLAEYCPALDVTLKTEQLRSYAVFASELQKWNKKVNLTAITTDKEIAVKHFIDSLHLMTQLIQNDRILDIGSGAGFPAIPLKIVMPETKIVSVDSVAKKINFQNHIIRLLNLHGIEALHTRVEGLAVSHGQKFSLITSRAFSSLEHFVAVAAPLLSSDGRLIAMKGAGADQEIDESCVGLSALGFSVVNRYQYFLPYQMGDRTLVTLMRCKAA